MISSPPVMRSWPHAFPHAHRTYGSATSRTRTSHFRTHMARTEVRHHAHVRRNLASDYDAELAVAVDMSLSLAQSGQMISSPSVMKPLPAMESWHIAHIKHWECQWRPSNEIKRVPPAPVMGLLQAVHRLANNSPKQLAQ